MSADYTPTTTEIREDRACWVVDEARREVRRAEFDRWLQSRDREVAAKALEDFAEGSTPVGWPDPATLQEAILRRARHIREASN